MFLICSVFTPVASFQMPLSFVHKSPFYLSILTFRALKFFISSFCLQTGPLYHLVFFIWAIVSLFFGFGLSMPFINALNSGLNCFCGISLCFLNQQSSFSCQTLKIFHQLHQVLAKRNGSSQHVDIMQSIFPAANTSAALPSNGILFHISGALNVSVPFSYDYNLSLHISDSPKSAIFRTKLSPNKRLLGLRSLCAYPSP